MKKIFITLTLLLTLTLVSNAQCNADFSFIYTNSGWTLSIYDESTVTSPDYIVSWSWEVDGNLYASTQDIVVNNGGSHDVCLTIVTNNGCTSNSCQYVTDADPCATFAVDYFIYHETLLGDDGTITGIISGGTSPYSYTWSTGASSTEYTDTIYNLSAGTYYATVTDGNSCEIVDTLIVNLNTNCDLDALVDIYLPEMCGDDGFIEILTTGGLGSLTYNWSNGDNTQNIYDLSEGSYTVTVEDAVGCIDSLTVDIVTQLELSQQHAECNHYLPTDSVYLYSVVLTTPEHADITWIIWKNGVPVYATFDQDYTCLECFVPVFHLNNIGCPEALITEYYIADTVCVDTLATSISNIQDALAITNIYPNPVKEDLNINISSNKSERTTLLIYNYTGQLIHQEDINVINGENIISIKVNHLKKGIYLLKVNEITQRFVK